MSALLVPGACINCGRTPEDAAAHEHWARGWTHGTLSKAIVGIDTCRSCGKWMRFRLSRGRGWWCQLLDYWCQLGIATEEPIAR